MKIYTKKKIKSELIETRTLQGWRFTWLDGYRWYFTEQYMGYSKPRAREEFVDYVYNKTI